MSTGLNCRLIEPVAGEWYYVLENSGAPKNAWDWREYAEATGPFPTEDACSRYLMDHEANPGGWSVSSQPHFERDAVYSALLLTARTPQARTAPRRVPRWGRNATGRQRV